MLKNHLIITILISLFSMGNIQSQSYFDEEYLNVWQRTTDYTLEVADRMPVALYGYKPSDSSMTFKEQQLHIVRNISFLTNYITGDYQKFYEVEEVKNLSKEEVLEILTAALQYVNQLIVKYDKDAVVEKIEFKGVKMSKENIFYLIRNHLSHHRAQCALYLRMNHINAPEYVGW